jgi:hypothetical protein
VRLEEADQLVGGRHALTEQDPPLGLSDDLLHQGSKVGQGHAHPLSRRLGSFGQVLLDPFGLVQAGACHPE